MITNCCTKTILILAILLAFAAYVGPIRAEQAPQAGSVVRFGFHGVILEDTNPKDALAATRVWADTIGVQEGLWEKSEAQIYSELDSLIQAIKEGDLDIFAVATADYLSIAHELDASPALTFFLGSGTETEYIILTHKEQGSGNIQALQDKKINVLTNGGTNMLAETWCAVLLGEAGLGTPDHFFSSIKRVRKASQGILPVFFKQVEAAVVTRASFELAVELNPQLGRQLEIIGESEPYVPVVVCIRNDLDEKKKRDYIEFAIKLHENPNAMQTFLMFRLNRLVRWKPEYLSNVRELLEKHREISKISGQATANSKAGNRK
jgi:ABC-type phosphate/phosphonate transport system substrate-binding protein